MAKPPQATSRICARCGAAGSLLLAQGGLCAECQSTDAWRCYAGGQPLIISRQEIEDAKRWAPREPSRAVRGLQVALGALSLSALAFGVVSATALFARQSIGSLKSIIDSVGSLYLRSMLAGAACAAVGIVGSLALRRSRLIRSHGLTAAHLSAAVAGVLLFLLGAAQHFSVGTGTFQYSQVPAIEDIDGLVVSPQLRRVAESTAVVVAPDKDGDARFAALGAAAVIARSNNRAWLVTCSHVAIPYESTAAFRDPAKTHAIWIEFSDGRGGPGQVTWAAPPPLDIAIVAVNMDDPPPAVRLAADTGSLDVGSEVLFVPNPLRSGWKVHRGTVVNRRTHQTPAGEYSLVFTDLPLQRGDSGSGLYDGSGRLVGLNTWTQLGENGPRGISLPTEALQSMVAAIESGNFDLLDGLRARHARESTGEDVRP